MKKLLLILLCGITFFACQKEQQKTIILSKASSNYIKWIEHENVIILDAYTIKNTDSILALADGIILTGGEDINPLEYNDTINIKVCGAINYSRDTLERKLFDFALLLLSITNSILINSFLYSLTICKIWSKYLDAIQSLINLVETEIKI